MDYNVNTNKMKTIIYYNTKEKNEVIVITNDLEHLLKQARIKNGTLLAYSLHTTLSLIIQETGESNLCQDFIEQLTKMVDDDGRKYKHTCAKHPSGTCEEDKANGPSHVRQLITNQNLIIDIKGGKLNLGQWQDIALLELDGPRKERKIMVKIIKD